jgi:Protein of unknown function (DUF1592)/Protein of unknown function (DUF1588)/Protein of unknown function (DUF1595)/Protein of unknown function (DUF1585)/Protein of unknown function (DUF1587)
VIDQRRWHMLGKYCEKCHNTTDWAGGVAFDTMAPSGIATNAKIWEAAVGKLQGRLMPPPGQKQPSQTTVDGFVSWLEGHLDAAAAAHPDPGFVVMHRLNRTEYARSIRQILGVKVDVSTLLPKDTLSDGFDDIGAVLKVSPTFLDQYISAASTIAALAVGDPHARSRAVNLHPPRHDQNFHIEGLPLGTRGGFLMQHDFPADGTYVFNFGGGRRGAYFGGLQYRQDLLLLIDGKKVFETSIGGAADYKEADQNRVAWAKELNKRLHGIRVHLTAGPHAIGVGFVQDSLAESDDWLQPFDPRGGLERAGQVTGLEVVGPIEPTGVGQTPSRRKIFVCHPTAASEELPCARRIVAKLTREAYRRPVTAADLAPPLAFYTQARQSGGSFDRGIENAVVAILASPNFLYRIERPPQGARPGTIYRISDVALASRLAFFLWAQGPDEQLLDLAAAGKLHDPKVLAEQVYRMLADPRAESLVTNFAFQWLQVDDMDKVKVDPTVYPDFDSDLRAAFRQEMRLFLGSVLLQDRDVTQLLTANWTFVNGRLALHYGIAGVRGSEFRRVILKNPNRWGLLGKGAILLGTSYGNRTAPVLRGAWVLDDIVGESPHAPPPNIPPLKENVPGAKPLTIRQRMIMHRSQPSCNACHGLMDPIGLALENFDAVGRWRIKDYDTGTPIDAAGEMAGGFKVDGPSDVRRALMSRPRQFVQTLTARLMTYALGRTLDYHDMPEVRSIVRSCARHDYRFSSIVLGIVESPQFQMQEIPGARAGASGVNTMTTQASHPRRRSPST